MVTSRLRVLSLLIAVTPFSPVACKLKPGQSSRVAGTADIPGTRTHSKEDCVERIPEMRREVERLRGEVAAETTANDDGRVTTKERELWEAQKKLDHCRFERTDYAPSSAEAGQVEPRSFEETCRIVNGNRICNMPYHKGGNDFVCRHYAGMTEAELKAKGIPCSTNTYSTSHVLGGHANNIIQVASSDPERDRYCLLEPQANNLTDCWYVAKGAGPGSPPAYAYGKGTIPAKTGVMSMIASPTTDSADYEMFGPNGNEDLLNQLGSVTTEKMRRCYGAYQAHMEYCRHTYAILVTDNLLNIQEQVCYSEADTRYRQCVQ